MEESKVAKFRQEQALQEQALQLGLSGLAFGVSRHDFIEARAERGANHILQLLREGKEEEARALMNTKTWGENGLWENLI